MGGTGSRRVMPPWTKAASHTGIGVALPGEPTGNGKAYGFSETPIVAISQEAEEEKKARKFCRQHGIEERPHHSLGSLPPALFRRPGEQARHSTLELSP